VNGWRCDIGLKWGESSLHKGSTSHAHRGWVPKKDCPKGLALQRRGDRKCVFFCSQATGGGETSNIQPKNSHITIAITPKLFS